MTEGGEGSDFETKSQTQGETEPLLGQGDNVDKKVSSVDEIFDAIGWGAYQYQLLFLIGGSMACDGMELTLLAFIQNCIMIEWNLDTTYESVLTSSVFVGQIIGMLVLAPLADHYGRRFLILLGWGIVVVFGLLSCISPDIWFLVITRGLVGVGIGGSQSISYDLFVEAVPTQFRGRIMYVSIFSIIGELYVVSISWGILETWGWRYVCLFCALPILIIWICGVGFLYESPRWLAQQKRFDESEEVLNQVAQINNAEIPWGKISLDQSLYLDVKEGSFTGLWETQNMSSLTSLLWSVWFLAYFTYYCIFLVVVSAFENESTTCSYNYSYIFLADAIEIIGVLLAFSLVDYVGRISTHGYFAIATTLVSLIFVFLYTETSNYDAYITFLMTSKVGIAGAVSSLWLLTAEIYPTELRATGHSCACIAGRLGAFAAVFWIDDFEGMYV